MQVWSHSKLQEHFNNWRGGVNVVGYDEINKFYKLKELFLILEQPFQNWVLYDKPLPIISYLKIAKSNKPHYCRRAC